MINCILMAHMLLLSGCFVSSLLIGGGVCTGGYFALRSYHSVDLYDNYILGEITKRLNKYDRNINIYYYVNHGKVLLLGDLSSLTDKDNIINIIKTIKGVEGFYDYLSINQPYGFLNKNQDMLTHIKMRTIIAYNKIKDSDYIITVYKGKIFIFGVTTDNNKVLDLMDSLNCLGEIENLVRVLPKTRSVDTKLSVVSLVPGGEANNSKKLTTQDQETVANENAQYLNRIQLNKGKVFKEDDLDQNTQDPMDKDQNTKALVVEENILDTRPETKGRERHNQNLQSTPMLYAKQKIKPNLLNKTKNTPSPLPNTPLVNEDEKEIKDLNTNKEKLKQGGEDHAVDSENFLKAHGAKLENNKIKAKEEANLNITKSFVETSDASNINNNLDNEMEDLRQLFDKN